MDLSDDEVQAAASIIPALAPVCKTLMTNRMRMDAMERKKDAEVEVVEAKQRAAGGVQRSSPSQQQSVSQQPPEQQVVKQSDAAFDDSIDQMIDDEDCQVCARLLDGVKRVDDGKRAIALSEYGRFKQAVDDTQDVEAIRDQVAELPVLESIMMSEFNMEPAE